MCDDTKKQILLEDEVGEVFRRIRREEERRRKAENWRHARQRFMYYHGHLFDVARKKINGVISWLKGVSQ